MLSADDVLRATFPVTSFREGYDQAEVDRFLDRAARTLRERATRPHDRDDVTAGEVEGLVLRTRTFVQGYDMAAVDDLLERLRASLAVPPSQDRPAPLSPLPDAPVVVRAGPRRVPFMEMVAILAVGLPRQRPPRTVRPARARRVRARWVQVTPSGITWAPPLRAAGHVDAADVEEIVELVLSYPKGGTATYYLVVDHDGVARLRVHEWWHRPVGRMWTPLAPRVRVTAADPLLDRAKDARRTWPEAFTWVHAYPYLTLATGFAAYLGVLVPVLEALGVE